MSGASKDGKQSIDFYVKDGVEQSKLLEGGKNKNYDNTEIKNIVSKALVRGKGE